MAKGEFSSLLPAQRWPGGRGSLLSAAAGLAWWASSSPLSTHYDGPTGCCSPSLPVSPARLWCGGQHRARCVGIPRACSFLNRIIFSRVNTAKLLSLVCFMAGFVHGPGPPAWTGQTPVLFLPCATQG